MVLSIEGFLARNVIFVSNKKKLAGLIIGSMVMAGATINMFYNAKELPVLYNFAINAPFFALGWLTAELYGVSLYVTRKRDQNP